MSIVTNIILVLNGCYGEDLKEKIDDFFSPRPPLMAEGEIDFFANMGTGDKVVEADIFIGAYNHFDTDGFIEHLKNVTTSESMIDIQLFVKEEHEELFYEKKINT